jgi:prepilin-type N-terminal cleavage/methylation domain-containing protein
MCGESCSDFIKDSNENRILLKNDNRGFSLVEIIIVIAIMAILSAALVPQLMKYIEQSRVSTDMQTCGALRSVINTAVTNEKVWYDMAGGAGGRGKKFRFYMCESEDGKILIDGINVNGNSANEIRKHIRDLDNPKQTGKYSYEIIIYSKTIETPRPDGTMEKTYTLNGVEVYTSDKKVTANSSTPYNY